MENEFAEEFDHKNTISNKDPMMDKSMSGTFESPSFVASPKFVMDDNDLETDAEYAARCQEEVRKYVSELEEQQTRLSQLEIERLKIEKGPPG
jgi:hypothetical protein